MKMRVVSLASSQRRIRILKQLVKILFKKGKIMIGGIKTIIVKSGNEKTFETLFNELKREVQKNETGNVYYDLYRDLNSPGHYRVLERYLNQNALDAHQNSEYGKIYFPKIRSILENIAVDYFESVD